jgi:sulfite exporter TauE/SafE
MATIAAVFVASLVGSLHCAGMCGPLVAFALGTTDTTSHRQRAVLQFAYHGGRLVTYSLLGAVCGLLGAALDLSGSMVGMNRVAALLAGLMMVGVGIIALLRYSGVRLPAFPVPKMLTRMIVFGQRAAVGLRPFPRALTIGLLTTFLPCGWLYMFAIVAAGAGSALGGAAIMIAFWAGTVPVLASLGIGVQAFAGTLGRRMPLITSALIVLLGLFTIGSRSIRPAQAYESPITVQSGEDSVEQVKEIQQTTPPCCRHKE